MARRLVWLAALAALPLLAAAAASAPDYAEGAKATRTYSSPDRTVCGDRLCSEVPGGYEAWRESGDRFARSGGGDDGDRMEGERMGDKTADGEHMDGEHMDGEHMDGEHMDGEHMDGERMDGEHMGDKMAGGGHMADKTAGGDRMHGDRMGGERMADKTAAGERMDGDRMADKMADKMDGAHMGAPGSLLKLSRASVPAAIPMHLGVHEGGDVYFIVTDSSDEGSAAAITEAQGWRVEVAPPLAVTPEAALSSVYTFTNGVEGGGMMGYQADVFASTPAQPGEYSALAAHFTAEWAGGAEPRVLGSVAEVMAAESSGDLALADTGAVINAPHVAWPGGQMPVREDASLHSASPYGGGQLLSLDTESMVATFVAHRGWGPDGRTIYYIVTDATPAGPAGGMGVVHSPTSAALLLSPAAVDLFQFSNGIAGPGPLGFQPGIAAAAPGDDNYSPMWRISIAAWADPYGAELLETASDIAAASSAGEISVALARPMDSDHIVNCPFIDPFQ